MLIRLWWKEARALGPSWPLLFLAACGVQWLLLASGDVDVKGDWLPPAALVWAVFYAFACGASAFAGERESRSLGFLDALPVPRGSLWLGKASFALASTFGLAVILAVLGAAGMTGWGWDGPGFARIVRVFGVLLVEGVAWSLLWSSLLGNPLAAGALGVVSVGLILQVSSMLRPLASYSVGPGDLVGPDEVGPRLALAAAALAASALILIRPRWRRRPAPSRPQGRDEPIVASRASAGRSLIWQARREGRSTWLLVLALGLYAPLVLELRGFEGADSAPIWILAALACLVAGVSVFGPENAAETRRFLLHQGVGPGQVWARKVGAWALAMAIFGGALFALLARPDTPFIRAPERTGRGALMLGAVLLDASAVGVLAGMAIHRRITALLVGTICLIALAPPQIGLLYQDMIPGWSLLITPAVVLGASRIWAGDWLADRPGARPWIKLGLLLAVPGLAMTGGFVGYRAFGEPDAPPAAVAPAPIGEDLTDRYREIIVRSVPAAIEQARAASAIPRSWVSAIGLAPALANAPGRLAAIRAILLADASNRLAKGDLPGAWEGIIALLRVAEQAEAGPASIVGTTQAALLRGSALDLALDWAAAPKQDLGSIRKARGDLDRLAPPASIAAAAAFRAESRDIDRTLTQPAAELGRGLLPERTTTLIRVGFNLLVASPWERRRATMLSRRLLAEHADRAALEPWQRPRVAPIKGIPPTMRSSPLAFQLLPNSEGVQDLVDHQVESFRAVGLVLAVRGWQLAHDGKPPATLDDLAAGEPFRIPTDPYSGGPYRSVEPTGQPIPAHPWEADEPSHGRPPRPARFLIYSVGPDGVDDGGKTPYDRQTGRGDLIRPIP